MREANDTGGYCTSTPAQKLGRGIGLALTLGALLSTGAVQAAERTGQIDDISKRRQVVVINDAIYTVAAGTVVRHAKGRTVNWQRVLAPGQYVSFKVESAEHGEVVTSIRVLPGAPPRSSE